MHSTGTKLAAPLLKGRLADFKGMLDANEVGGTALLGIRRRSIKAHGSASEVGFCNAVRQAMEVARSGIIGDIEQNIDKMRIDRRQNNANARSSEWVLTRQYLCRIIWKNQKP